MHTQPSAWHSRPPCDQTAAWRALQDHHQKIGARLDMRQLFAQEPERFAQMSLQAPHVLLDLSRHLWTEETRTLLLQLAHECGVAAHRAAMFAGEAINVTEARAVGHVRLRAEAAHTEPMLAFAEAVRSRPEIRDVVNIGVGGSDLGVQMAVQALAPYVDEARRFHFVSNVDGHDLQRVLRHCQPESTLFLVASKTFTTAETMTNAATAKDWFLQQGGAQLAGGVSAHFVGLTAQPQVARAFGVGECLEFAEWVGGRYSLWSAIGLSLAIAIGAPAFRQLLAGARAMDEHFALAPPERNLPLQWGLLDVWYRNFMGFDARCVAPYDQRLARLPAYLQQLEMESNGKSVDAQARALSCHSSALIWGEPGTNGQHAFFQMLHQGTAIIPLELIVVRRSHHPWAHHHRQLLANALAQAQALMWGKADANGHKNCAGNRPSSFMVLERLDPASFGALIALYEHRTFVAGSVWGINSFDQFGVELGKVLARDMEWRLQSGDEGGDKSADASGLDASSAALLRHLRD